MSPRNRPLVKTKLSNETLIQERHLQIVECATPLFLKNGFHSTTTRDIAASLGWNIGTLYLYITSKEDVLYLISDSIMRELFDGLRDLPHVDDPVETLIAASRHLFYTVDRLHSKVRLIYRESASMKPEQIRAMKENETERRDYFSRIIRDGESKGVFQRVDEKLLAYDILVLSHMWALKGWALAAEMTIDDYFARQMAIILGALGCDHEKLLG